MWAEKGQPALADCPFFLEGAAQLPLSVPKSLNPNLLPKITAPANKSKNYEGIVTMP
jgi:hypothetical protein